MTNNSYFIDSNFIIGLINKKDQLHENCINLSNEIVDKNLILSELVLNEVTTIIGNKIDIDTAIDTFFMLHSDNFTIVNEFDIRNLDYKIILNYEKYNEGAVKSKRLSYTDCAIITVMKELGITNLVSYDVQFERVEDINLFNNL